MNIEFTEQEAQDLVGLLDVAVKAGGLQVAAVAIVLTNKIQTAFSEAPKAPAKASK